MPHELPTSCYENMNENLCVHQIIFSYTTLQYINSLKNMALFKNICYIKKYNDLSKQLTFRSGFAISGSILQKGLITSKNFTETKNRHFIIVQRTSNIQFFYIFSTCTSRIIQITKKMTLSRG